MTTPSPNAPSGSRAGGSLEQLVQIPAGTAAIEGALALPRAPAGLVLFAHGSGSSRHSPRNNYVARVLRERNLGACRTLESSAANVPQRPIFYRLLAP